MSGKDTATAQEQTGNWGIVKRLLAVAKPWLRKDSQAMLFGSLGHLSAAGFAAFGALAAVSAASQAPGWQTWGYFAAAIVFGLVRGPFAYLEQLVNHDVAFRVLADLRQRTFSTLRRMSPLQLMRNGRGDLVSAMTDDIEKLELFFAHTLSPSAIGVICAVVMSVASAIVSPLLGLVALVSYLVIGGLAMVVHAITKDSASFTARSLSKQADSLLLSYLEDTPMLARIGARATLKRKLSVLMESRARAIRAGRASSTRSDTGITVLTVVSAAVFSAVALASMMDGSVTIGAGSAIIAAFIVSFEPVVQFGRLVTLLQPTLASADRLLELLDEQPELEEVSGGGDVRSGDIVVDDLDYAYPSDANDPVLQGASLHVENESFVAIAGPNGSGKSTLLHLLMRYLKPQRGHITIGASPLADIDSQALRNAETLTSSGAFIFKDTLRNNVALANPEAGDAAVEVACSQARLGDLIAQLPGGLDHRFTQGGTELSDGERQRVAMARAFLSPATIILLDEPTGNMDALLEAEIMTSLADIHDTTLVMVSHSPKALTYADRAFVLREGRLQPAD